MSARHEFLVGRASTACWRRALPGIRWVHPAALHLGQAGVTNGPGQPAASPFRSTGDVKDVGADVEAVAPVSSSGAAGDVVELPRRNPGLVGAQNPAQTKVLTCFI